MKNLKFVLLVVLIILTGNSQGDIIITRKTIPTSHVITNVKDFSDVTFFVVHSMKKSPLQLRFEHPQKIFENGFIGKAIMQGEIFAVKNEYLKGKNERDIDWEDKTNVIKSNVMIPSALEDMAQSELKDVKVIENKYTIAGFNDSLLVLYKSQEIYKFKEELNRADSIMWDEYVEVDKLRKTFN